MAAKKRFGVSVPAELACELNNIAEAMGVDRSKIVSRALRSYIKGLRHYGRAHECVSVLVATGLEGKVDLEKFTKLVCGYSRFQANGSSIEVMVLKGDPAEIVSFYSLVEARSAFAKLVPIR